MEQKKLWPNWRIELKKNMTKLKIGIKKNYNLTET